MSRRLLIVIVAFAALVFLLPAGQGEKMNVLFIISDDLRTELECYGGKAITPNLDRLAAQGVRFDKAYCQYPLCNPSRTSMLTGRHPTTTRLFGNREWFGAKHPDWVSLPKYFKENGYVTLRAGKIFHGGIDDTLAWTEGGERRRFGEGPRPEPERASDASERPRSPRDQSRRNDAGLTKAQRSDRWIVLEGNGESNGDYRVAERAIEYLRRYQDSDQPFFLGCGFSKPHSPLEAPQRFYDLYDLEEIQLPPDFAPSPTVPEGFPAGSIRPRNADLFISREASPREAREMIRAYLASTSYVDWNVGRVLAELDALGLREKTIVVFWGDHGYQLGEKGKWSKAGSLWEQGARVPTIIYNPRARGNGQSCPRVVQSIDFYPTLVDLCGLPRPEGLEGLSLAPLLNNPQRPWDHPAYTVWSEDGRYLTGVSVRTERWHYAEFFGRGPGAMLLDPERDPYEMTNLVHDPKHADVVAELSSLVKSYAEGLTAPERGDR